MSSRAPSSPRSANGEPCLGNTELPVAGSPSSYRGQHGKQGKDRASMQGGGDFSSTQESKLSGGSIRRPGGDAAANRGDYGDAGPPDSGRQIDWSSVESARPCGFGSQTLATSRKSASAMVRPPFSSTYSCLGITRYETHIQQTLRQAFVWRACRAELYCALSRASSHTLSLQEDLDVKEQINSNLKRALEEKTRQIEAFRSFLLQVESLGVSENSGLCLAVCAPGGQPLQHQAQAMSSQDEFASLMQQSEYGLRKLVARLQQYED
ncbi:fyve zinc finger domain-containing protein, partial [Cystoisospora suis]